MDDDNVRRFPLEKVDRVLKVANAVMQVLDLAEDVAPEDFLAAILLVQTAIQQGVSRMMGPGELQRVLIAANEKRRQYSINWNKG